MSFLDVFRTIGIRVPPVRDEDNPRFLQVIGAALGGFAPQPRPDNFTDQLRVYKVSAIVYRCAQLWAESILQARVRIVRVKDQRVVEEVTSGSVWDVLEEINGHMAFAEWMYKIILDVALTGNSYTWKVRDRAGNVVELWPFRPDEMEITYDPLFDPKGKIRYLWRPLSTGTGSFGAGGPFVFSKHSILHLRLPSPLSPVFGTGPVRSSSEDILADQRAKRSTLSWLENEGVPAGVLETDSALNEDEAEIIKQRWRDAHSGPDRSGKIAVLGSGTKFNAITVTPKDIEWMNQRKVSRAGILMAFGVPPIYAGLEGENFANRKEQRLLFWQDTIRPKLRLLEGQLSEFLLRDFDPEFRWIFDERMIDAFVEQIAGRVNAAVTAANPQARVMRPFEARQRILGIEERFEGDDEFVQPTNFALGVPTVDQLNEQAAAAAAAETTAEEIREEELDPADVDYRKRKFQRFFEKQEGAQTGFGKDVQDFLADLNRDIQGRLTEGRDADDVIAEEDVDDLLPSPEELEENLLSLSRPHIESTFRSGVAEGEQDIEESS